MGNATATFRNIAHLGVTERREVFSREEVENIIGARVAEALRTAAEHFDNYDVVTIEDVEVGGNMVPISPAERFPFADEVDAS